jgi:hypothetical protein
MVQQMPCGILPENIWVTTAEHIFRDGQKSLTETGKLSASTFCVNQEFHRCEAVIYIGVVTVDPYCDGT